jgi:hypothetical protein
MTFIVRVAVAAAIVLGGSGRAAGSARAQEELAATPPGELA